MADTPVHTKLEDLRVTELRSALEKRGLGTSGVKAVLADRLTAALVEEGVDVSEVTFGVEVFEENMDKMDEELEDQDAENLEEVVSGNASKEENTFEGEEDSSHDEQNNEHFVEHEDSNLEVQTDEVEEIKSEDKSKENNNEETKEEESESMDKSPVAKEAEEDSIMIGDGGEEIMFEDDAKLKSSNCVSDSSKPVTVPAGDSVPSEVTASLNCEVGKEASDNSSIQDNPDESQNETNHESGEEVKQIDEKKDEVKDETASEEKKEVDTNAKNEEKVDKKSTSISRNLWVSGLASATRATDLKTVFSKYGRVIGAKVVTNARTPGARCYGYITMNTSEDAGKCIQHLNRTEIHGRMITVEKAKAETGPAKTAATVEVGKKDGEATKKEESKDAEKKDSQSKRSRDTKKDVLRSGKSDGNAFKYNSQSSKAGVLTFSQIKDQRKKELEREDERRRRERERRRGEDDERRRRESSRRQREEEERIRREREELRREREKLEREKQELMKFERERQRLERERLEREKEELERLRRQQSTRLEDARRGSKRPGDDRDPYYDERKRNVRDDYTTGSRSGVGNSSATYDYTRHTAAASATTGYDRGRSGYTGGKFDNGRSGGGGSVGRSGGGREESRSGRGSGAMGNAWSGGTAGKSSGYGGGNVSQQGRSAVGQGTGAAMGQFGQAMLNTYGASQTYGASGSGSYRYDAYKGTALGPRRY